MQGGRGLVRRDGRHAGQLGFVSIGSGLGGIIIIA